MKKILQLFEDKMSINVWIDNLTFFPKFFTKKLISIFSMQQLHVIYAIWEIFHFYAIWELCQLRRNPNC